MNFLPCFAISLLVVLTGPSAPPTCYPSTTKFTKVETFTKTKRLRDLRVLRGLSDDVDTHRAGGSSHCLDRRLEVLAVEVRQLRLRDVLDLPGRHRAHLVAVGLGRSLGQIRDLLEQHRRGRRLGDEGV